MSRWSLGLRSSALLFALLAAGARPAAAASSQPVSVDGSVPLQKMDGFGTSINAHSWDGGAVKPALDALANTMGTKIWRVVYEMSDWEATNDDADPFNFDWTRYDVIFTSADFEELWSTIGYLNQRGFSSTVMLDFMGRIPPWMGGSALTPAFKDELVETLVAAAYYGRVRRGLQFGIFAPLNEVDFDGIEGPQISASDYADVMNRIALRLDALGLRDLKLAGPDTAQTSNATGPYFQAMTAQPTLMAHLSAFGLHHYAQDGASGLPQTIQASAFPDRHAWLTETSSLLTAWAEIEGGMQSVLNWDGYDSVYAHAALAGRGTTAPNDAGPQPAPLAFAQGVYTPRKEFYQWQQLYRFVAPGAQRVSATTGANGIHVLAFTGPLSGQLTIVGRNDNASSQQLGISLRGVGSPVSFSAFVTSPTQDFAQLAAVPVVGSLVTFSAPANSIFTLTSGAASVAAPLPAWVDGGVLLGLLLAGALQGRRLATRRGAARPARRLSPRT